MFFIFVCLIVLSSGFSTVFSNEENGIPEEFNISLGTIFHADTGFCQLLLYKNIPLSPTATALDKSYM
jgi:hypothetical protein